MTDHTVGTDFQGRPVDRSFSDAELERYERQGPPRFPELGLGMMLWDGVFEGVRSSWLRWTDEHGVLIPTGKEDAERERRRAERLAALLRRSGIDPEQE